MEQKNIAANIMAEPTITPAPRPMPSSTESTPVTSATTRPAARNTPSQARPNTVKAQKLRRQATRLKNSAFTGGTPCQCTRPGACQNSSDSGRYKAIDSHMAV